MQQLFFMAILAEMTLIIVLSFKTPLRKVMIMGIDRLKRGRGPVIVKTVSGTVSVLMFSTIYSMLKIQKLLIDEGALNPTDQVLLANYQLESTLMGASLFLILMVDRLHHHIRELRIRRKSFEAVKKQGQGFEGAKLGPYDEIKKTEEEINTLRAKYGELTSELDSKTKEVNVAEASAVALRKQSDGIVLERTRLLEENYDLRNRLKFSDRSLSRSIRKKDT